MGMAPPQCFNFVTKLNDLNIKVENTSKLKLLNKRKGLSICIKLHFGSAFCRQNCC